MSVATDPKRVPDIRLCPYCGGVGTCEHTEIIIPGVRKVRHYKCGDCLRYWQQPIVIEYLPRRIIRTG